MNKVYVAATYADRKEAWLKDAVDNINKAGFVVRASWLNVEDDDNTSKPKGEQAVYALQDIRDIDACDYIVVFLQPKSSGKNFELGYAFGWHSAHGGKKFVLIGEPYSVFHSLFPVVPTVSAAIELMLLMKGN